MWFLAELLAAEVDDRAERRRARRITDAKFPRLKRLSEFNVDAVTTIEPAQLATLASGHYLNAGEPVVLLGDSGTGKTHLLIGLGLAAWGSITGDLRPQLAALPDVGTGHPTNFDAYFAPGPLAG